MGVLLPAYAHAGMIQTFFSALLGKDVEAQSVERTGNIQTMELPRPAMNIDPKAVRGGGDITIVDDSALLPDEGPSGTLADIEKPKNATISVYVVKEGDTLSEIAALFDVTPGTILSANDLTSASRIRVGQQLVILPITGVRHTVKKGDTVASIAKKYKVDPAEILTYNNIEESALAVGAQIIVPHAEYEQEVKAVPKKGSAVVRLPSGTPEQIGYYLRPLIGGKRTQGIHGYNGVDLAGVSIGTAVMAAAEGDVIVAREGGYNGGYGSYVVIQHGNGSQTLYAHLSSVSVYAGQHVVQGQVIGGVGNTGKSTGPHLHFEVRNGIRNPF